MCNYADDIKTPTADAGTSKPLPTATDNGPRSGVQAHSGPDMWTPATIVTLGNPDLSSVEGTMSAQVATGLLKRLGIGHKKLLLMTRGSRPGLAFLIKTSDVHRLPDGVWKPLFDLGPAQNLGGGRSRRPIAIFMTDDYSVNPITVSHRAYLVQRNVEFAARQDISMVDPTGDPVTNGPLAWVALSDKETLNG